MKSQLVRFGLFGAKVNRQYIQMVMTLIALILLVLGIGAPADGGDGFR
jgi:hypothetical protein